MGAVSYTDVFDHADELERERLDLLGQTLSKVTDLKGKSGLNANGLQKTKIGRSVRLFGHLGTQRGNAHEVTPAG